MTRLPATCAAILLATTMANAQNQSQMGNAKRTDPKPAYDLRDCMVYIPEIKDPNLRAWCLAQSRRLP